MDEQTEKSTAEKILDAVNIILQTLGDVSLDEAKTWAETEINARSLRDEGHEESADG